MALRILKTMLRPIVRRRLIRSVLERHPALIVLVYHAVDPEPPTCLSAVGVVTPPASFEDHVRWVRGRYDVVALSDGILRVRRGALQRTAVAFTFDDGLRSFRTHALPILRRYEAPATLFVNRAALAGEPLWIYRVAELEAQGREELLHEVFGPCHGPSYVKYLRWSAGTEVLAQRDRLNSLGPEGGFRADLHLQLADLGILQADPLVEIGNHSLDHPRFSRLAPGEQERQIVENHFALQGLAHYRPFLALPFGRAGDWDFHTVAATSSAGLEFVTALGGVNFAEHTGVDIRRIPCDGVGAGRLEDHLIREGLGVP